MNTAVILAMSQNGYPDRSHLPTSPGVYIFKDAEDKVIYVGKAKNVRARVANYFTRSGDGRPKVAELRERVRTIDFIVTESETEALVLESNLIKRHRPRFKVASTRGSSVFDSLLKQESHLPRLGRFLGAF